MIKEKRCLQCNEVKHVSEFYLDARCKDGYRARCKKCSLDFREKRIQAFKKKRQEEHLDTCNCKTCETKKLQAIRDIKKMLGKMQG